MTRTAYGLSVALMVAALGCSGERTGPMDAMVPMDDASPTEGSCVPNDTGGLVCEGEGAGCPYECCTDGVLDTCMIAPGWECAVVAPIHCGGDTCVNAGESCLEVDAGAGG